MRASGRVVLLIPVFGSSTSAAGCRCRVCCALCAVREGVWLKVFVLDVSVRLRVWLYAPCASGYGAGGNLFDVLSERQCSRHPLPERGVVDMFLPTCRAVAYLHSLSPPVAHRDIKVCPLGGDAIACPACLLSGRVHRWRCRLFCARLEFSYLFSSLSPHLLTLSRGAAGKRLDRQRRNTQALRFRLDFDPQWPDSGQERPYSGRGPDSTVHHRRVSVSAPVMLWCARVQVRSASPCS